MLLDDTDSVFVGPHLLPNGKGVVFGIGGTAAQITPRIDAIFEIETGEVRELVSSGHQPRRTFPRVIWCSARWCHGAPFDGGGVELTKPSK